MAIRTARLAEIYAVQGHMEDAASIYEELVEASPGDGELRRRLSELRDQIALAAEATVLEDRVNALRALKSRVRSRRRVG